MLILAVNRTSFLVGKFIGGTLFNLISFLFGFFSAWPFVQLGLVILLVYNLIIFSYGFIVHITIVKILALYDRELLETWLWDFVESFIFTSAILLCSPSFWFLLFVWIRNLKLLNWQLSIRFLFAKSITFFKRLFSY